MMGGYGHGFGMGWWWIIGVVVVIVVVWAIVKGLNQSNQSTTNQGTQKSALDILKEQYASGEIDKEEFEERKKNLQ